MGMELIERLNEALGTSLPITTRISSLSIEELETLLSGVVPRSQAAGKILTRAAGEAPARVSARVVAMHFLGGDASCFAPWAALAADNVEVLTATWRGDEAAGAVPGSIVSTAAAIAAAIAALEPVPTLLYGHSMGALLAYEVALALHRSHAVLPTQLVVGAMWAPQRHEAMMTREAGTLPGLLRALAPPGAPVADNAQWQRAAQADLAMMQAYRPRQASLPVPVLAVCATGDPIVSASDMRGWNTATSAGFTLHELGGDHLFLLRPGELLAIVRTLLPRDVHEQAPAL